MTTSLKTVLVTGGSGFIGSNFIEHIMHDHNSGDHWNPTSESDKPMNVVNLDKLTYAANGNFTPSEHVMRDASYTFVKGDINDTALVKRILTKHKPAYIINFAAESHVDNSINDPAPFIKTNVNGTLNLLNCFKQYVSGIMPVTPFLHVSTDEVFGSLSLADKPSNENTPYAPRSPYAASKAASDHLCMAYRTTWNLPITVTHCGNNYGPGQHGEKFIPTVINNILNSKPIPIYGGGSNIRDWIYVRDHCEALRRIMVYGKNPTYCIGGREDGRLSNIELVKKIIGLMPSYEPLIKFVPDRPGHDFRYELDGSKLAKAHCWQAQTGFNSGLSQTIAWYSKKAEK